MAVGKLPVSVHWSDGSRSTVELDVAEPPLPADADVSDIKAPMRARPALWPWLLAAALAYAAWRWWKARPAKPAAAPAPPRDDRPAEAVALAAIDELERSGLWGEGRRQEFYFRLTDILRAYLERRLSMPARKLTTTELSRALREGTVDRDALGIFKELFQRADLAKFAKSPPEAGQGPLDLDAARRLVALTAAVDLAAAGEKKP